MATRAEKSARRRREWHESRVNEAATPRQRLWSACGWLVAEAWRLGRLDDATDGVLTLVHHMREEPTR